MTRYDSENDHKKKQRKFKDYYDESFREEDRKEILKRRKKLGKPLKGKKSRQEEWPIFEN